MKSKTETKVAAKPKRLGDAALMIQSCLRGHHWTIPETMTEP